MATAAAAKKDAYGVELAGIKLPKVLVNNVCTLMSLESTDYGEYYLLDAAASILRSYTYRGARYFWSQVDAQALVMLLDKKVGKQNAAVLDFQQHWGESALDDLEKCQTWLESLPSHQAHAVQNLPYWLWYALGKYKKVDEWEKYAQVFTRPSPTIHPPTHRGCCCAATCMRTRWTIWTT